MSDKNSLKKLSNEKYDFANKLMVYEDLRVDKFNCKFKYSEDEIHELGDLIYNNFIGLDLEAVLNVSSIIGKKMYEVKVIPDIKVIAKYCIDFLKTQNN